MKKLKTLIGSSFDCLDSGTITTDGGSLTLSSCGLSASSGTCDCSSTDFFGTPVKNGFACPKCGSELFDDQPMVTLTSWPAQKTVKCFVEGCGYSGYRYC